MAQTLATPGVYIEERNAFGNSVAGIPTAIPAFIGYTEKVTKDGESLINKPVRISSFAEFVSTFGSSFQSTFHIEETANPEKGFDFEVAGKSYSVLPDNASRFILFDSIRLFYANGGGTAYVISAGAYTSSAAAKAAPAGDKKVPAPAAEVKVNQISKKALEAGIQALVAEDTPTMLVIPEAVMLEEADCFALQQEMLMHCGFKMKNRFALLDVYNGSKARTYDKNDVITRFREGVGSNFLAYGASYYPNINSAIVQNDELNFKNISNLDVLETVLSKEADTLIDNPKKADEIKAEIKKVKTGGDTNSITETLLVICPSFKKIMQSVGKQLNLLPPSAAMAGLYTMVDNSRGVWKAPANISVASAVTPAVQITHDDQEDLNVTVTGKSVNAIRSFVGEGTMVWGARTMDGNSKDWRYINVRRTLIFLEQSIKFAAKAYVYEPNTAQTWTLIKSMISSFLNTIWKQGGLVGLTPTDAYDVQVGLNSTMTADDILEGIMKITVRVAVSRPAEFIVITFEQKMQES